MTTPGATTTGTESDGGPNVTTAQLVLVSVTSALVAVIAMLVVASLRRPKSRDKKRE